MKRHTIILVLITLVCLGAMLETQAEVSVAIGRNGQYLSTVVVPGGSPSSPGVWGGRARAQMRRSGSVLNPHGDIFGDSTPLIVESNITPHHPLAVWSRFDGENYDLVWSRWNRVWSAVAPIGTTDDNGDDRDPHVVFDRSGRAYMTWWSQDANDGHGSIYFSMFLESQWLEPVRISPLKVGGRYPLIQFGSSGHIEVVYQSDDGRMTLTQQVFVSDPGTITDDIDPQTMVSFSEGVVEMNAKAYTNKN